MTMIHIEKPANEIRDEIIKVWPYGMFELWDNGDVVINAESVSRWDGRRYFIISTRYCHIHLVIPVNK